MDKNISKKELRLEYIRLQNELNEFTEYYSTDIFGYDNNLILTDELQKKYDSLIEKLEMIRKEYKAR